MIEKTESSRWGLPAGELSDCTVTIQHFDGVDRASKAGKFALFFLALAAATVPIPIVHMFAVPLFSAIALGSAIYFMRMEQVAKSASGTCPACNKAVTIDLPKSKPIYPLWLFCNEDDCRERLKIVDPALAWEEIEQ